MDDPGWWWKHPDPRSSSSNSPLFPPAPFQGGGREELKNGIEKEKLSRIQIFVVSFSAGDFFINVVTFNGNGKMVEQFVVRKPQGKQSF